MEYCSRVNTSCHSTPALIMGKLLLDLVILNTPLKLADADLSLSKYQVPGLMNIA